MNEDAKSTIIDSAEHQTVATVECNNCSEDAQGEGDGIDEANKDLISTIKRDNWYVGSISSEHYGAEFSILCPSCLQDIVKHEKMSEVKSAVENKMKEMA
jgi:hypothetical protein